MSINVDAFLKSLPIMGLGLLGIFVVTLVIIIAIYILRFLSDKLFKETEVVNDDLKDNIDGVDDDDDIIKEKASKIGKKPTQSAAYIVSDEAKGDSSDDDDDSIYMQHDL